MPVLAPYPTWTSYQQTENLDLPQRPYPLATGLVSIDLSVPALASGALVDGVPDQATGTYPPGEETIRTFHGWYYRVHIVPTTIELGSVTSDQVRTIMVWNADFYVRNISSTVLNGDAGLSLTSPVTPPAPIGPLQVYHYLLTVAAEGAANIEGDITWVIDGQDYVVPIHGRRRVLFSYGPNWTAAVTDTLNWATTVNTTWSGREQRNRIARQPRRAVRYNTRLLRSPVTQNFDSAIFGWQGRLYLLPLWQEASALLQPVSAGASVLVVDTNGMTLEPGCPVLVYLDSLTSEMNEVLGFDGSSITLRGPLVLPWGTGCKIIPCIDAIPIGSFATTRQVPTHVDVAVGFTANPAGGMLRADTGATPAMYRGDEVYYEETDWANGINLSSTPNSLQVDTGMANIDLSRKGDFPFMGRSFRWVLTDRDKASALRQFFCRRAGKFRPVWLPSGTDDFTLIEPIETVTASIVVRNNEYTSLVQAQRSRRDIVFMLRDGQRIARRIVSAVQTPDRTVLTLDAGFDEGIRPEQIKRISYLGLYRLEEDYVTFNWNTDRVCVVETNFVMTEPDA